MRKRLFGKGKEQQPLRKMWKATDCVVLTVQRTRYYPSGLPWEYQAGDSASLQPYKFNGYEFIETHGYDVTDLGNRGVYHAINRFTSMDRFAEKYPWQSPYVHAGNNPVNFVDVGGDSIWVIFEENGIRQQLQYIGDNLYNTSGELYEGDNEDALMIKNTLNTLKSIDDGDGFVNKVISTLESSDRRHYIEKTKSNYIQNKVLPYPRHYVNAERGVPTGTQTIVSLDNLPIENNLITTNETTLGHELRHAYDYEKGLMKNLTLDPRNGTAKSSSEIRAVGFENRIRKALGLPLRTTYGEPIESYPYAR